MSRSKIFENIVSLGSVQAVSLFLPLLAVPYLAQVLGAEELGRTAFAIAVSQAFVILSDYGFNLSAAKSIARIKNNIQEVADIWISASIVRLILAIAGVAIISSVSWLASYSQNNLVLIYIAYISVIGNVIFPQWLFQGMEKLRAVSFVQVFVRCSIFASILLIVKTPADIYWAVFLQSAASLFSGLLTLPLALHLVRNADFRVPTIEGLIRQIKEGWHVFASTAAINLYTTCNTLVLGLMVSPYALGQFHVADRIIKAGQALYAPISGAVYPHAARLAETDRQALLEFNRRLFLFCGSIVALGIAVVYVSAPFFVPLFFGSEYLSAVPLLRIMCLIPLLVVASNIAGIQTMLTIGMEKQFSKILIGAALINFLLFVPLSWRFGSVGAAVTNLLVEFFVTFLMITVLRKISLNPISIKYTKIKENK